MEVNSLESTVANMAKHGVKSQAVIEVRLFKHTSKS
jgi:hypothetical protein